MAKLVKKNYESRLYNYFSKHIIAVCILTKQRIPDFVRHPYVNNGQHASQAALMFKREQM